jgi:hypothetical protein
MERDIDSTNICGTAVRAPCNVFNVYAHDSRIFASKVLYDAQRFSKDHDSLDKQPPDAFAGPLRTLGEKMSESWVYGYEMLLCDDVSKRIVFERASAARSLAAFSHLSISQNCLL